MPRIILTTDGGCVPNPGIGAWAYLLEKRITTEREFQATGIPMGGIYRKHNYGVDPKSTNQRMELTAVAEGLAAVHVPADILLITDSAYVKNGISKWIQNWKRKGWKTAEKEDVKNRELWERIDREVQRHNAIEVWLVKGHSGNQGNEFVDAVLKAARQMYLEGMTWCMWCGDRPSVPGYPCDHCENLGATYDVFLGDNIPK